MALPPSVLLTSLKDFDKCNEELTLAVKRTILEPFQPDLSQRDPYKRTSPPSRQEFKTKAKQLSPLAMRIVNQNIDSLKRFKEWKTRNNTGLKNSNAIKHCLIDTSFYATAALKHMKAHSSLKPLDIEKTLSNLICKLVDLGEWARALEELRKFRQHLASIERIQLDKTLTMNLTAGYVMASAENEQRIFGNYNTNTKVAPSNFTSGKGILSESPKQQHSNLTTSPLRSSSPELVFVGGRPSSMSSWEEEMVQKYADLFTFPLNTNVSDRSMILLVLAYQMNVIRSWCDINDGALVKYIAILLDRPGNFIDWCKHLMNFDDLLAKKQFDLLHRHLSKTANKYSVFDDPLQTVALQVLALRSSAYTEMVPLRLLCDRFVRLGISYEKSSPQVKYDHLQKYCSDMLQILQPTGENLPDLEAYFVFCEYYAYVSRKAKSYTGAINAFTSMIQLVDNMVTIPSSVKYYHVAYVTHAKLSLSAVKLDEMVHSKNCTDIIYLLTDISSSMQALGTSIQENQICNDSYTEQAVIKVCKSMHSFRHSSSRLYEFIQQNVRASVNEEDSLLRSPSPSSSPSVWDQTINGLSTTLQQCSVSIPLHLNLIKKMGWINKGTKSIMPTNDMMLTFVDTMILLAKIHFDVKNDNTYYQAYDYLATAEQFCADYGFSLGYRWISALYYTLGAAMVTSGILSGAVYPLRKACTLLEKDTARVDSDAGRLQLAKRYEVLGTCCQKNGDFEAAVRAFRMALKRVPPSEIALFTTGAERMSPARMIEQQPLVPKLIDRFLRSSVGDHEQKQSATEFMDLSTITPIQRCILHECELQVLFVISTRLNLVKQQNWLISSLLYHYTAERYPIRRARILLSKIRVIHANGLAGDESIRSAIALCNEAQGLLKYKDYGADSNLLNYRRHYLALSCSWLGILRRELNEISPKTFVMALHHWGKILKKVNSLLSSNVTLKEDLEQVCLQVDDLDSLYDHLRILVDLFSLIGHSTLQINVLRLLLKLNNGLRESSAEHISDSVIISTNIGRLYTDLGYSGRASLEFTKVKNVLDNNTCSPQAELHYFIQYSYHLSVVGDYDSSQKTFNLARTVWESTEGLDTSNKIVQSLKQQAIKVFLVSDCHLARSTISLHKESLDIAISDITSSYQVLSQYLKSIKRRPRQSPTENIFLDNKSSPKRLKETDQFSNLATEMVFKECQWMIARKMGVCFQRLALLHMTRGTWRDAQYYLSQGRQLGERIKSNAMVYRFLILLSDSYLRTGQLDKSKSMLELANEIQPVGPNYLREDAQMKTAIANIDANQGFLDEALQSYASVDDILQQLMDPVYIITLEKLTESDEDFERQLAVARDAHLLETGQGDSIQYECQSLREYLGENMVSKALITAQKGLISTSLKYLEKFEEDGVMPTKEDLLKAASAHIRLLLVKDELKNHADLTFMESNVLTLPSLRLSSQRGGHIANRGKAAHHFRLARDGVSHALERLLATHRKCAKTERVSILHRICYEAGFGMFLKNQVSIGESILVNNYAALSGYYLEMAKAIGIRREMQSCLDQKLSIPLSLLVNDGTWPKRVEDFNESDVTMGESDIGNRRVSATLMSQRINSHLTQLRNAYRQEHDLDDTEFQNYFINILPAHWTVCSLSLDKTSQDLYIAQYRTGEPPFVVKLPLNRLDERRRRRSPGHFHSSISYEQALEELQDIIQLSDETIHSSKVTLNKKDIEDWWMTRSMLDNRLKKLLEQMEKTWIGGFKGLLCGRHYVDEKAFGSFQQTIKHIIMTNIYGSSTATANRRSLDIGTRNLHMILRLGAKPSDQDVEDIVYFLLACFESQQVSVSYATTIIERMTQQVQQAIQVYHQHASQSGIPSLEQLPNEHLILIPDKHTQSFPLESMPTLRPQAVSRLPCISFLRDRILYARLQKRRNQVHLAQITTDDEQDEEWQDITIDASKTYYVLNPSGDLKYTQSTFEHIFARMHTWEGHVQKKPSEIECRSVLKQKELYMYFGHSAGQSFIRGQVIRQLPRCPVTLLMGCSSGALQSQGEYDPHGYVLNYLFGGSPAVVANLWDVTDKSIDQITKNMMERWGLFDEVVLDESRHDCKRSSESGTNISLVQSLVQSREDCQLPYLIGASSVVYGVPVYVL